MFLHSKSIISLCIWKYHFNIVYSFQMPKWYIWFLTVFSIILANHISDVCSIRLDFESFTTAGPTLTTDANACVDSMTVTAVSKVNHELYNKLKKICFILESKWICNSYHLWNQYRNSYLCWHWSRYWGSSQAWIYVWYFDYCI